MPKILVAVSEKTNEELSHFSKGLKISKSELVRNALDMYIRKLKTEKINEELKKGYTQMADINLTLAEMYFESDENDFIGYEEKLSESEISPTARAEALKLDELCVLSDIIYEITR